MSAYDLIFRGWFSHLDPERIHAEVVAGLRVARAAGVTQLLAPAVRPSSTLAVTAFGVRFPSPFGMAAGFDKRADAYLALGDIGFGHVEVGTITARAQPGNPRPRLARLVADRALVNRMGFNNPGAEAAAAHLMGRDRRNNPVVGVNIGKSRVVPVEDAVADYVRSATVLAPLADYLAVNVSSPNTPGLRALQRVDSLRPLLTAVSEAAAGVPVLVKIAPDMPDEEVVAILRLAEHLGLAGIIATNTTVERSGLRTPEREVRAAGAGGLSGQPLRQRSLQVLRLLAAERRSDLALVSVGGVDTAYDVWQRLAAGATLVQGYSAFIYRGPLWAATINRDLARLLARSPYNTLGELTASAFQRD